MYKLPPLLHLAAAWVVVALGIIVIAILLVTFWLQLLQFAAFIVLCLLFWALMALAM